MKVLNVEIKAACMDPDRIRHILKTNNARFVGCDHQLDTYYSVGEGRLKLREGEIENTLIHYVRANDSGPKRSDVRLFRTERDTGLKEVLERFLTSWVVVDKKREIYFIENVKFHLDEVCGLGWFVEIEAIDEDGKIGGKRLREQCERFQHLLEIDDEQLLTDSYSDMLVD